MKWMRDEKKEGAEVSFVMKGLTGVSTRVVGIRPRWRISLRGTRPEGSVLGRSRYDLVREL